MDQLHEDQPLVNVIDIESFKKYNFIIGMPKEDNIKSTNVNSNCQCCIMFWPFDDIAFIIFIIFVVNIFLFFSLAIN